MGSCSTCRRPKLGRVGVAEEVHVHRFLLDPPRAPCSLLRSIDRVPRLEEHDRRPAQEIQRGTDQVGIGDEHLDPPILVLEGPVLAAAGLDPTCARSTAVLNPAVSRSRLSLGVVSRVPGAWSRTGKAGLLGSRAPATGERIADVYEATPSDYAGVLERARAAFDDWKRGAGPAARPAGARPGRALARAQAGPHRPHLPRVGQGPARG